MQVKNDRCRKRVAAALFAGQKYLWSYWNDWIDVHHSVGLSCFFCLVGL